MRFVALSSSRGTTLQAILDAIDARQLSMACLGLVTDRDDRGCADKARAAGLPVRVVTKKPDESREAYDARIDAAIRDLAGDRTDDVLITAVGWMWLLSPWFVQRWPNRIVNVHPSLLPKYPGTHAHEEVLEAGDDESGMTIHLIDTGVDTGKILLQKKCPVRPDDTPETLKERVQELEKEWYPKVLRMIEEGTLSL